MNVKLLLLALTVLWAPLVFAVISSDEAQAMAAPYIGTDSDIILLSKPLEVGSGIYWLYFYSIYSAKKVVVAVNDDNGALVADEPHLSAAAGALYKMRVIDEYVVKNKYSFDVIMPVVQASEGIVQQNQNKLSDLRAQTESKYPALSFDEVDANLQQVSDLENEALPMMEDGSQMWQSFQETYAGSELPYVISTYNSSYDALFAVFDAYNEYSTSITELQSQVSRAGIKAPDSDSIYNSLENMRDIGLSDLYGKFASQDPRNGMNSLLNNEERWVNDSVGSFFFRKTRMEVLDAYDGLKPLADYIVASESLLKACDKNLGSQATTFKRNWADIEYYRGKGTSDAYNKMAQALPAAQSLANTIQATYNRKCGAPSATPVPQQQNIDFGPVLIILLFAAMAYVYFKYLQKKGEQSE
ncbi:MAG: hypothetical protein V1881_01195 [Candidatus Micrarchaeota archaeon]